MDGDKEIGSDEDQVEPQEKKKTPKGRAKKRITYTRRFVNVTMTGGKRKVSSRSASGGHETDNPDEPEPNVLGYAHGGAGVIASRCFVRLDDCAARTRSSGLRMQRHESLGSWPLTGERLLELYIRRSYMSYHHLIRPVTFFVYLLHILEAGLTLSAPFQVDRPAVPRTYEWKWVWNQLSSVL